MFSACRKFGCSRVLGPASTSPTTSAASMRDTDPHRRRSCRGSIRISVLRVRAARTAHSLLACLLPPGAIRRPTRCRSSLRQCVDHRARRLRHERARHVGARRSSCVWLLLRELTKEGYGSPPTSPCSASGSGGDSSAPIPQSSANPSRSTPALDDRRVAPPAFDGPDLERHRRVAAASAYPGRATARGTPVGSRAHTCAWSAVSRRYVERVDLSAATTIVRRTASRPRGGQRMPCATPAR